MLRNIPCNRSTVAIAITVHAAMGAGVIHSNIRPQKAVALCAGRFFPLRHRQTTVSCCLQHCLRHAAGDINTILRKRYIFAAGANWNSVFCADFCKPCGKVFLLQFRHRPCRWEVSLCFFIQVKKAYDTKHIAGKTSSVPLVRRYARQGFGTYSPASPDITFALEGPRAAFALQLQHAAVFAFGPLA